jgi:hypothetical protein
MAGWSEGHLQEDGDQGSLRSNGARKALASLTLLQRSYKLCRESFEEYFPLVVGASIVACAICYGLEGLRESLWRRAIEHGMFGPRPNYARLYMFRWFLWCSEVFVGWILATFTFAWVAVKVLAIKSEASNLNLPASQAFRSTMARINELTGVAVLGAVSTILFCSFLLPLSLRSLYMLFSQGQLHEAFFLTYTVARDLILAVFALFLAAMAPAIPSVIDDPSTFPRDAISLAIRSTAARLLFLSLWLGATAGCGGLIYMLARDALRVTCMEGRITPPGCYFLSIFVAAVIIAVSATPAFIYFSLLFADARSKEQVSRAAVAH